MKTKTKTHASFLFALATILCCMLSVNSFGQTPGPDQTDFYGTWQGTDVNGNTVEIILNANSTCVVNINGTPNHAGNPIQAFRLPEYAVSTVSTTTQSNNSNNNSAVTFVSDADMASASGPSAGGPVSSPFSGPQRTIKFFTQDGLRGIPAPVHTSAHDPLLANPDPNSVAIATSVQQIYTGLALVSINGSGQYEMALFINMDQFSSVPPAVDFSINPMGDASPYATLIRQ